MTYPLNRGIFLMKRDLKTGSSLKIADLRSEYKYNNQLALHRLAVACAIMFSWLLIWALVFKLGSEILLVRNYSNLKGMTFEERIMWDLIPFNYRGTDYWKMRQVIDTVLNCFVFVPLAISLCYAFEKKNIFRDLAICFGFSIFIEAAQLFTTLGNPSTEDLITNVAGCFIGHFIYCLILKRLSLRKSVIVFNTACIVISLAVVFSLVTTGMAAELILKIITKTL